MIVFNVWAQWHATIGERDSYERPLDPMIYTALSTTKYKNNLVGQYYISKTLNSIDEFEPTIEWLLKHLIEWKRNRLLIGCF